MSTTAQKTLEFKNWTGLTLAQLIEASSPNTAARIERAIAYAMQRKRETKVSYLVTDFGHSAMDCPLSRAAYKDNTIIFKS